MDKDIIVIFSNCDCTYVTLNGKEVGYGMEHPWELADVLTSLFNKLEHSYNQPLIYHMFNEDYFSYGEQEAFYERTDENFFTQDELQVLVETGDINKFYEKISANLQPRASEIDKSMQEM